MQLSMSLQSLVGSLSLVRAHFQNPHARTMWTRAYIHKQSGKQRNQFVVRLVPQQVWLISKVSQVSCSFIHVLALASKACMRMLLLKLCHSLCCWKIYHGILKVYLSILNQAGAREVWSACTCIKDYTAGLAQKRKHFSDQYVLTLALQCSHFHCSYCPIYSRFRVVRQRHKL